MGNALEFILRLTDQLSPAMRAAARVSDSAAQRIKNDLDKTTDSSKRFKYSLNELRAKLDEVNSTRNSTNISSQFKIATEEARRLERQIERIENKGKGGSGGFSIGNLVKGNLISQGIAMAGSMIKDGVADVYQTTLKNSSLKSAINATTGGQGKEAVRMTASISDKYGLNYEASLEGVKTLTGGLKGMNIPLREQMKIFEGVSTGVAAMKLSADESKGAMLALGQMASKGTVSAEELRGQLGERIPGAFGIAAKAMNVTEAQLNKMLQKGDIASKDFLPKFAAEMQKTFGADALAAANGPQAIQERFNNAVYNIKTTIGDGLMPVITPILEKLTQLGLIILPYIQTGISGITWLIEQIVSFIGEVNSGTSVWSSYFDTIKSFAFTAWEVIRSIAGNIWNIVSGVVSWLGKSEIIKDLFWVIGQMATGILVVLGGVGDAISWIWDNIIKPFLDGIEWVYGAVKGLMGLGDKKEVQVTQTIKTNKPPGLDQKLLLYQPKDTVLKNGTGATGAGSALSDTKSKSENINSGGSRPITINIGKQIEKLEVHVASAREGAEEIGAIVREQLRRVLYSVTSMSTT